MDEPARIKLTIAYDGTRYAGWQVQKNDLGVQQVVQEAIARVFPEATPLHGSSRTDTGVHAIGMVGHFDLSRARLKTLPIRKLPLTLNAHLPPDIRVMAAARAANDFNSRFDASGKQYRYFVWNHHAMNPLLVNRAWNVRRKLNVAAMKNAAPLFLGRHDFRSLAATRPYVIEDTVRTLTRCDVKRSGDFFTFIIEGDGFLYKMCRAIVGTLVQVGEGKIAPEDVTAILEGRDRRRAGVNAPACGLVLWKVFYPKARKT